MKGYPNVLISSLRQKKKNNFIKVRKNQVHSFILHSNENENLMAPSRKHKKIRKQKSKVKHYHKPSYKRKQSNKPYI